MGEEINVNDTKTQDTGVLINQIIDNNNASIDNGSADTSAAGSQPEDTAQAYMTIIKQQTEQINALIEQTQRQQSEITRLLQNGAVVTDGNQADESAITNAGFLGGFADFSDSGNDDFVGFKDLGKFIGSKDVI